MRAVILSLAIAAAALPAQAIEGRYRVEGTNPGQTAIYHGEVILRRSGETYTVAWQIGASRQIGTGIVTGPVFSVIYEAVGSAGRGVASYAIIDGRVAEGRWANVNTSVAGRERWTPVVAE